MFPTLTAKHPLKFWNLRRYATARELADLQGFPQSFILPTKGVVRLFGNTVSVPVVEWIVRKIKPTTFLDLFSGIGGFHVALKSVHPEIKCVGYSEILPCAVQTYEKNFPNTPALGDICSLKAPPCDLICAGFPCKPFARPNYRLKATHPLRGMYRHVLRCVEESGARFVVMENVPGLLERGREIYKEIVEGLSNFEVSTFKLNSADFGLRQSRKRVYILAVHK